MIGDERDLLDPSRVTSRTPEHRFEIVQRRSSSLPPEGMLGLTPRSAEPLGRAMKSPRTIEFSPKGASLSNNFPVGFSSSAELFNKLQRLVQSATEIRVLLTRIEFSKNANSAGHPSSFTIKTRKERHEQNYKEALNLLIFFS